jgi:hypothetical protein
MNDARNDQFFTSREDGSLAAWSLHSPALPGVGQWSWISVGVHRVMYERAMSEAEIAYIRQRYMVWGMKLADAPWALVQGRPGKMGDSTANTPYDPTRSVGV